MGGRQGEGCEVLSRIHERGRVFLGGDWAVITVFECSADLRSVAQDGFERLEGRKSAYRDYFHYQFGREECVVSLLLALHRIE